MPNVFRPCWYTLDGHTPRPISDEEFWASTNTLLLSDAERRVGLTMVGEVSISTVFLQLDHAFRWSQGGERPSPPILFETMVFGGRMDMARERYATWEEAEAGHARWVETVRAVEHAQEGA